MADWLTLEESARLLKVIFPGYPNDVRTRKETPPMETWKCHSDTVASAK